MSLFPSKPASSPSPARKSLVTEEDFLSDLNLHFREAKQVGKVMVCLFTCPDVFDKRNYRKVITKYLTGKGYSELDYDNRGYIGYNFTSNSQFTFAFCRCEHDHGHGTYYTHYPCTKPGEEFNYVYICF